MSVAPGDLALTACAQPPERKALPTVAILKPNHPLPLIRSIGMLNLAWPLLVNLFSYYVHPTRPHHPQPPTGIHVGIHVGDLTGDRDVNVKLILAQQIDAAVKQARPDDWRGVETRERVIKQALYSRS